jgi:hypothetical protein
MWGGKWADPSGRSLAQVLAEKMVARRMEPGWGRTLGQGWAREWAELLVKAWEPALALKLAAH